MATGEVVSVGREAKDGELILLCQGKIASVPRDSVPIRRKERKKITQILGYKKGLVSVRKAQLLEEFHFVFFSYIFS